MNFIWHQVIISGAIDMFTWLNKQGVQSDSGFVVQFTGRFSAEYRENDKIVTLYVEDGLSGGIPCIILDPGAFERWDDGTPIALHQQTKLFQNVKEAMDFQGLEMVVEAGKSQA
jgi:hypothetical protein